MRARDAVKICRNDERFWVRVTAIEDATKSGTVNNVLIRDGNEDLAVGTPVRFERRHVFDTILLHVGETEGQMNREAFHQWQIAVTKSEH